MKLELIQLSEQLGKCLAENSKVLTTAESCTGGLISAVITEVSGSSLWFDRAFITYSNDAKQDMLGVQRATLEQNGAVSENVVCEMAQGALACSKADLSLAVSGIAGPTGGSEEKPVGTVCIAWASKSGWQEKATYHFIGDRQSVREQTTYQALARLLTYMESHHLSCK